MLKKIVLVLAIVFIVPLLLGSQVSAQERRTSQVVVISPPAGEQKDFYLGVGETVEVTGEVSGDIYAVGGEVLITGKVNGDVLALGGTVVIKGEVTQDVRIIGGDVYILGKVGRNLTVASKILEVLRPGQIGGGILAAAGSLTIAAPVGGQVKAAGGNALFADIVGSDVEVWSDSVNLSSTLKVGRNFVYYSNKEALVQSGASVSGQLARGSLPEYSKSSELKVENFVNKVKLQAKIVSFLAALIVGLIILKLVPAFLAGISGTLYEKPWKSFLVGFISLFLIPIICLVIFVTLVGIPLSVIVTALFLISLYLTKIFVSYHLGVRFTKIKNSYLAYSLGLLILYLISLVPIIRNIVPFLVYSFGLGAFLIATSHFVASAKKKASI